MVVFTGSLLIFVGLVIGVFIAWVMNRFMASKVKNKGMKYGLVATAYIVCIILSVSFIAIGILHSTISKFMTNRMVDIEVAFSIITPGWNLFETNINTNNIAIVTDEVQKVFDYVDTSNDTIIQKIAYGIFLRRMAIYVRTAFSSAETMIKLSDEEGNVSVKTLFYHLKDRTLDLIELYTNIGRAGMILLFLIFIAIYVGIFVYLKKGGEEYNKSIVINEVK